LTVAAPSRVKRAAASKVYAIEDESDEDVDLLNDTNASVFNPDESDFE
jgi:hypothetical protein